jgi:hypothetical protein
MRLGVEVLYRESVDARRQKQIHMRRTCEGCRETERNFGEFMMCAGCRKVRYCSKASSKINLQVVLIFCA